jgi:hypothetical protein
MSLRVLVADVSVMDPRYAAVLPDAELRFARSMGEANRALAVRDFDLLVTGVQFDESRMFDLLWHLAARPSPTPAVCVRGCQIQSGLSSVAGLETAVRALGARDFIDFRDYPDDEHGNAQIRQRILACLAETQ